MPSLFKPVDRKTAIRQRSGQRYVPDFSPARGGREGSFNDILSQVSFAATFGDSDSNGGVTLTLTKGAGVATFTRATAAAARLESGLWNLNVASGVARSHYLPSGEYGGYLSEKAATQVITFPRDMTNAAWVKVGMTTAQTSTGLEGLANTCTRLTATVGGDTALQTAAIAATNHTYSAYVKRITGTGTITLKCAAATLDITALINSSTFTLVQMTDATLNAAVGFAITTIGDAIDVDCNQLEAGTYATTPIPAAGTRNADILSYTFAGNASHTLGTAYAEISSEWATADPAVFPAIISFGTNLPSGVLIGIANTASTAIETWDSTNTTQKTGLSSYNNTVRKVAVAYSAAASTLSITGGGLAVAAGVFDGTYDNTAIFVGSSDNISYWDGTIKNVKFWLTRLTDSNLQTLTT